MLSPYCCPPIFSVDTDTCEKDRNFPKFFSSSLPRSLPIMPSKRKASSGYFNLTKATQNYAHNDSQIKSLARSEARKVVASGHELKVGRGGDKIDVENDAGEIISMCPFAQGDAMGQREGNMIKVKGFQLNFSLVAGGTHASTCVRMLVVADRQGNGTAPTLQEVLGTELLPGDDRSHNTKRGPSRDRFIVFYDKMVCLTATKGLSGTWSDQAYRSCKGMKVSFDGALTTNFKNHLFLCLAGDEPLDPLPSLSYVWQTLYYDA